MTNIKISQQEDGVFGVALSDNTSSTTHIVTVTPEYLNKLGWHESQTAELLEKTFAFLLERESKESILADFDLSVISNYFPEYETHIHKSTNH